MSLDLYAEIYNHCTLASQTNQVSDDEEVCMTPKVMARSGDNLFHIWGGGVVALLVAALLLASCGTEVGQQGGDGSPEGEAKAGEEAGQTRPAERVTIEELADNPSEFYGESVTVSGEVIETVEPGAFRIEGDDGELLVVGVQQLQNIAKGGDKEVSEGDLVRATGEVRQFKLEEVRNEVDYGIDNEYFGDFTGEPAVLASSFEVIS